MPKPKWNPKSVGLRTSDFGLRTWLERAAGAVEALADGVLEVFPDVLGLAAERLVGAHVMATVLAAIGGVAVGEVALEIALDVGELTPPISLVGPCLPAVAVSRAVFVPRPIGAVSVLPVAAVRVGVIIPVALGLACGARRRARGTRGTRRAGARAVETGHRLPPSGPLAR